MNCATPNARAPRYDAPAEIKLQIMQMKAASARSLTVMQSADSACIFPQTGLLLWSQTGSFTSHMFTQGQRRNLFETAVQSA